MKIKDWLQSRKNKPGETSGKRVNESIEQHNRLMSRLLPQKKAWLIDMDGTKNYHVLDTQKDGSPSKEIKVATFGGEDSIPDRKVYEYDKEVDGFLIYYQSN